MQSLSTSIRIILQVSVFSLLIEENENLKVLRSLRTLRALRPLRAISRYVLSSVIPSRIYL